MNEWVEAAPGPRGNILCLDSKKEYQRSLKFTPVMTAWNLTYNVIKTCWLKSKLTLAESINLSQCGLSLFKVKCKQSFFPHILYITLYFSNAAEFFKVPECWVITYINPAAGFWFSGKRLWLVAVNSGTYTVRECFKEINSDLKFNTYLTKTLINNLANMQKIH